MSAINTILQAIVDDRNNLDIQDLAAESVQHAINAGLGPALDRATRQGNAGTWREALRAQALASRVESQVRLDALEAILKTCSPETAAEVLLLKGMSLCRRIYQEPHLRMMGDIDLLVPGQFRDELNAALRVLGYLPHTSRPPERFAGHHHDIPRMHPRTGVVIEVHTALFPETSPLGVVELFRPESFLNRCRPDHFRGIQIRRLDDETEVAYVAAHWINERRFFGSAIIPMLDLALMLRRLPAGFDLNWLLSGLAETPAVTGVRLAIGFVDRHLGNRMSREIHRGIRTLKSTPGPTVDPVIFWMIDRYALRGARYGRFWTRNMSIAAWEALVSSRAAWLNFLSLPWNLVFPAGNPKRFEIGFLMRRLLSPLRGVDSKIPAKPKGKTRPPDSDI